MNNSSVVKAFCFLGLSITIGKTSRNKEYLCREKSQLAFKRNAKNLHHSTFSREKVLSDELKINVIFKKASISDSLLGSSKSKLDM